MAGTATQTMQAATTTTITASFQWDRLDETTRLSYIDPSTHFKLGERFVWHPTNDFEDQIWSIFMYPKLENLFNRNLNQIFGTRRRPGSHIKCYMTSTTTLWRTARPTVVASCAKPKYAHIMVTVLSGNPIIRRLNSGFDFYADPRPVDTRICAGQQPLPQDPPLATLCGLRIAIATGVGGDPSRRRHATLGGLICLDNAYYGLTAAHAFLEETCSDDGIEEHSDSGASSPSHSTRSEAKSLASDGSLSPASSGTRVYMDTAPYETHADHAGSIRPTQTGTTPETLTEHVLGELHGANPSAPWLSWTEDWALIKISDPRFHLPNLFTVDGRTIRCSGVASMPPRGKVAVAAGFGALHTAEASGRTVGVLMPNSAQMISAWTVQSTSAPGDCGSWVMDLITGELYGMIVASSRQQNCSFCLSMSKIFDSIATFTGGSRPVVYGLPESQPEPAVLPDLPATTALTTAQSSTSDPCSEQSAPAPAGVDPAGRGPEEHMASYVSSVHDSVQQRITSINSGDSDDGNTRGGNSIWPDQQENDSRGTGKEEDAHAHENPSSPTDRPEPLYYEPAITNRPEFTSEAQERELDARERELDARERELDARERELDARERELEARERELPKRRPRALPEEIVVTRVHNHDDQEDASASSTSSSSTERHFDKARRPSHSSVTEIIINESDAGKRRGSPIRISITVPTGSGRQTPQITATKTAREAGRARHSKHDGEQQDKENDDRGTQATVEGQKVSDTRLRRETHTRWRSPPIIEREFDARWPSSRAVEGALVHQPWAGAEANIEYGAQRRSDGRRNTSYYSKGRDEIHHEMRDPAYKDTVGKDLDGGKPVAQEPWPRPGRTKMRKWLVHPRALFDLGYSYYKENDDFVIGKALSAANIDEVVAKSAEFQKSDADAQTISDPRRPRSTSPRQRADRREGAPTDVDMLPEEKRMLSMEDAFPHNWFGARGSSPRRENLIRPIDEPRPFITPAVRHSEAGNARDFYDTSGYQGNVIAGGKIGNAVDGATREWNYVSVPPGTVRITMDGIGGSSRVMEWDPYDGSPFSQERGDLSREDRGLNHFGYRRDNLGAAKHDSFTSYPTTTNATKSRELRISQSPPRAETRFNSKPRRIQEYPPYQSINMDRLPNPDSPLPSTTAEKRPSFENLVLKVLLEPDLSDRDKLTRLMQYYSQDRKQVEEDEMEEQGEEVVVIEDRVPPHRGGYVATIDSTAESRAWDRMPPLTQVGVPRTEKQPAERDDLKIEEARYRANALSRGLSMQQISTILNHTRKMPPHARRVWLSETLVRE
ncbi:hypothetical protein A1O1_00400 [Capronia coronata CBS 617.96]|uniref:DUF8035 domain-containing protein n=1 Tax=Capronia coronata CBS 617.96 TaxID=1182541 RepID=W9YZZ8_9EURO|nr:uncharacterized protein A1O1_00400 [Capronia coronata CBS 617.96]EXJ95280.1 hypothetical protein A1O1_00400 [Capronia coronata CBS 617.96]